MRKLLRNQKGSTFIFFAVSAVFLIGFSALVTDIGMVTLHKARLSNAVDAAALAGAQELIYNNHSPEHKAKQYFEKNGYPSDSVNIDLEEDGSALRVTASYEVKFILGKVLGFNSNTVSATAKGKVLPIIGVSNGVRPFAIENQTLEFGTEYVLKAGGGDGNSGNYGGVSLGGNGANVYYNNIVDGYNGRLMVGDLIYTEPGNMSGPTQSGIDYLLTQCNHTPKCNHESFNPDCPRIITVIIIDTLVVSGRAQVQIIGFASFFLEGVAGSGNESEVTGRFIRTVTSGEVSESQGDFGLYGVRLME